MTVSTPHRKPWSWRTELWYLVPFCRAGAPTWPGTYAERRDTFALAALSLDVAGRRQPRIWGAAGLPSDACRLAAVPAGGALVLARSLLLFYTQVRVCHTTSMLLCGVPAGAVLHPGRRAMPGPCAFGGSFVQHGLRRLQPAAV